MVHSWFHDASGLFGGIFIVLSLCAASESVPTSEKCSSTNVFSSKSVLVNGEFAIMSKTAVLILLGVPCVMLDHNILLFVLPC